jgi:hypothetical protein
MDAPIVSRADNKLNQKARQKPQIRLFPQLINMHIPNPGFFINLRVMLTYK